MRPSSYLGNNSYLNSLCSGPFIINDNLTHLDQNYQVLQVVPTPFVKGLQQLETLTLGRNFNLHWPAVCWGSLIGILARVKALCGQFITIWALKFEFLSYAKDESGSVSDSCVRQFNDRAVDINWEKNKKNLKFQFTFTKALTMWKHYTID